MDRLLIQLLLASLGPRSAYRLGRALYQKARGDIPNHIMHNGEFLVQTCVVNAWKTNGSRPQRLVVFDVGANVGDWSDAFLKCLEGRDIDDLVDLYLFEPAPSTSEVLKARLGTQNPTLHYEQLAISSEAGESVIYVSEQSHGINSLHANPDRNDEHQIPINKTTVAEFCKRHDIQRVHLLKSDTEGHDMEIIRGALPLLAQGRISVLQFEYNHRWVFSRNFLRDAFTAIETLPYKLAKLEPKELVIFNEWNPELERFFEGNYALVHEDALKWFPTRVASWDRFNTLAVE